MAPRRTRHVDEVYEQEFKQHPPRQNPREDDRRWESGMRVNIPEFDGNTLNPKGFIDWLVTVEEVFEFKEVPEKKRVLLIATKLRGKASAWWQQLKLTRERVGKSRVTDWVKMKKLLRENFIPYNNQRLMYQRLQNLKQGTKSVEDYTTEFFQLIARNDIQETKDQLVSRYIGGLRVQIMESVNLFDPVTLSDTKVVSGNTGPVSKGVGGSNLKCFNCGEPGHRQSECQAAGKKTLFIDMEEDDEEASGEYDKTLIYDEEPKYEEEYVSRDVGVSLVVRRSCLTPKADGDNWLMHNIFQSTCTISGKVFTFVCDSGSYDNLIAAEAVQKLELKTEDHPKPYKLQWLRKGDEMTVSKRVHVTFYMGKTYKDNVWCDVVSMDACHLLLGRPWEYDRAITHNGRDNTYSFLFEGEELEVGDDVFVLIGKEVAEDSEIPKTMIPLLKELHGEGHVGRDHTLQLVQASYFWPTMRNEVDRYVKRCRVCQVSKGTATNAGLCMPLPVPLQPWVDISMDFVLGLPLLKGTTDAVNVAQLFFRDVYRLHGLPSSIVSDWETRFLSHFWRSLWKMVNTQLNFSSAYHPQTDGQTEVVNRSLGNLLRCLVGDHVKAWDQNLCQAEFAHNHAVNRSTGFSPFRVVYSAQPCDFVWAVLTKDRFSVGEYNKLSAKKIGPLEIVEKINPNAYRLKLPSHIKCSDVFNVKHLVPYYDDSSDDDLAVNSRTNFVYPRKNDAGPSVEERAELFLEAQDRVKEKA
nr:hypothetical protein [Tanacetum cinerariifolium]